MALDLTGIVNGNDFFSEHYLAALLEGDLRGLFEKWRTRETEEGLKPPYEALAALARPYFIFRADLAKTRAVADRLALQTAFFQRFFEALGYLFLTEPLFKEPTGGTAIPVSVELAQANGHPVLWAIGALAPEEADPLDLPLLKEQYPEALHHQAPAEETSLEDLVTKVIFRADSPPRWVLLYDAGAVVLLDRTKWSQKRLLRFDLREIFSRKSTATLKAVAALLHRDSLAPEDGVVLLDTLDENSHKHAFSVSEDLKYTVREAVELLGNEAVRYLREDLHEKVYDGALKAEELTRECLRWVYRMLFLFYVEARPELGYAPLQSEEYRTGYSLEALRDLAERGPLRTEEGRTGTFLDESLRRLFALVFEGFNHGLRQETLGGLHGQETLDAHTFRLAPLQSHLFDPAGTPTLNRVRFRDEVMRQVIEKLSLSRPDRRNGRQRISYAQLGINQLGAVYEGLLSYTGFFAEEDLYEVKKADEPYDELKSAYFVPERDLSKYSEKERVQVEGRFRKYPKGTFIYRLWGRNREKSASYYTPESLTRCVVKYALKELLPDRRADDILALTVCEPALGSGAFLNEAVDQLAEAYLERKQRETGRAIPHGDYEREKQKAKAYIADNNAYGVDLNPTAVELAEISLWLGTIYENAAIPWFGNQLAVGNSLIGARRQVFPEELLGGKGRACPWADAVPQRVEPGRARPEGTVYHFLVGDPGMAVYTDKVAKAMLPAEIKAIAAWRKEFTRPHSPGELKTLMRLSAAADRLWERHLRDRQEVERLTRQPIPLFGHEEDPRFQPSGKPLSTKEKDRLYEEKILAGSPQASAYRRLKLAMDYWCALWFWPLEKAALLPTRDEFLFDLQLLLEGQLVQTPGGTPTQKDLFGTPTAREQALALQDPYGIVDVEGLCARNERLKLAGDLAARHRFHHWELAFAEVFAGRGGFDLMVGNPPWIKVEWNEGGVLGDAEPLYLLRDHSAPALATLREQAFSEHPGLKEAYLAEYEEAEGTQAFLNARQNYPELVGMQTNLYKCFLPQAWRFVHTGGVAAFLHPEGVYDDPKGGPFRQLLYPKLRQHFQFQNELILFPIGHRERFGVHVYSNQSNLGFRSISNLFHPSTVDACFAHDGRGPVPAIKDEEGHWSLQGHAHRIIHVGEQELALFAQLYDEPGTPALQARLPNAHTVEVVEVLRKFAAYPKRLGDLEGQYYPTVMWDETNRQRDNTIRRETRFPRDASEWILSGPHFYVGNPFYKTPRAICAEKGHYDVLDLTDLPEDYLPRTNYVPACNPEEYRRRTPKVPWGDSKAITSFYRAYCRRGLSQSSERTFMPSVLPPGPGHIHPVISFTFKTPSSMLAFVSFGISVLADFFIKTTGKADLYDSTARLLPLLDGNQLLHARVLALSCLTTHYADLWSSCWSGEFTKDRWTKDDPRLDNGFFTRLTPQWQRQCALRTDWARRQALVEIDVLAAMALGLTCDELCAIYRIQFPVLRQNEEDTWYDRSGRIVFTCSKGLPGVGFGRPEWNRIKDMKEGTVQRTIQDDTLPGGPRPKTITYTAPFDRCDREADYRTAWRAFEARGIMGHETLTER